MVDEFIALRKRNSNIILFNILYVYNYNYVRCINMFNCIKKDVINNMICLVYCGGRQILFIASL